MGQDVRVAVRRALLSAGVMLTGFCAALPVSASGELEEIVVTAQKREQSLLEVPLAVSAATSEMLEAGGIDSVAELEFLMPSLVVAENSGGGLVATALVTRGIGVNGNIPYFEPSTALFIDGAYRSRSALGLDDLVNIDRVEYLRGPQSTLYGRNASAGVLSVFTQRPRQKWGGFLEITGYAEDAGEEPFGVRLKGEASGPLSERVGAGLSFTYHDREDLYAVTGSNLIDSVNGLRDYAVRGQVQFDFTDATSLRITGGTTDRKHNGPATELFFAPDAFSGLFPLLEGVNDGLRARQAGTDLGAANATFDFLLGLGAVPTPAGVTVTPQHNAIWDRKIHLNGAKNGFLKGNDATADLQIELANGLTLNSITSFNDYESFDTQDIDQLTMPIGLFQERQQGQAFGQELRLSSSAGEGAVDWIVGAFFLRDKMKRGVEFQLGPNAPILAVGTNGDTGRFDGGLDTDSLSVFGQLNWSVTERVEIAAGLRWIDETKEGFKRNSAFNGRNPASPAFLGGGFAAIFDPTDSGASKRSTDDITYSVTGTYRPSEDLTIYALHSRGFKSGGFNVVWGPLGPGEAGFEFKDETVNAFEVGAKGTFFDRRLQLSAALFHQTHDDYQTAAFIGTIFNLSNAEQARTKGVEIDMALAATESLRFTLNAAFTDAAYEEFRRGPCHALATPNAQGFCDQSGERLPFISDWTANVGAEYSRPVALGRVRLNVNVALADDYNPDLVLAPFLAQEGYTRLDLRAAWQMDRFDLTAFVENATNAEIVDWAGAANVVPGASGQFVIQSGRTYGLAARLKF